MSTPSPHAKHAQPQHFPSYPALPELAVLIQSLQDTAHALLVCCEKVQPAKDNTANAMPNAINRPDSEAEAFEIGGETRSYYFSPSTLRHERELLRKYHAKDFCGLLDQAHVHLVGLVKLMQSVHTDVRVRGYVISSLGCLLEQASALLLRMRNFYANVRPIENSTKRDPFQP